MDGDGKIDVDLAKMALADRVRPSGKTATALGATPAPTNAAIQATVDHDQAATSYHVARTLRETEEARMAKLKRMEIEGTLIRTADVRTAYAKRAAGLREALLQIPARLSAVLAAESDQAKCHDALQRELHGVLASVSGH